MNGTDRLRALAGAWDEWGLGGTLAEIADQIERELVRHDEPDSTDKGARLLYVTDEDREALEWVRKYGGIGCVQTMAAKLGDTLNWIRERAGISKYEAVDYDELLDALDRRLMPEGIEWPRYESGESVGFGDDVSRHGEDFEVNAIALYRDGSFSLNFWAYSKGERVKRPAPAVLAADGEPLEKGQTVWDVESGEELKVEKLCDVGLVQLLTRDGVSRYVYPDDLTHQRPVLDADGVPIKVGEHVWDDHGEELVVLGLSGGLVRCRFNGETCIDSVDNDKWEPSQLTHQRPDSWERIEEDAGCTATKYNERRGTIFTTKQQVARDLVRRARALAERERGQ